MKLFKDLVAFATEEIAVLFLACVVTFSIWATAGMVNMYEATHYCRTAMLILLSVAMLTNAAMLLTAIIFVLESFVDFCERRYNAE